MTRLPLVAGFVVAFLATGCVDPRCFEDADCPGDAICDTEGRCVLECTKDDDCASGFDCIDHRCTRPDGPPLVCPEDMVPVADAFCVDRHQAARPDATATHAGTDEAHAVSVAGVLPWEVPSNAVAAAACEAAGKRLCTPPEWRIACRGPEETAYAYGNVYDPVACNGIDAFCDCYSPACVTLEICPYPRCHDRASSTEGGGPCGAAFRVVPTGSFPACTNGWGVFDIHGNLWEHVAGGTDRTVRGGAYNCLDSAALHRCDYVPGDWAPTATGFRCCLSRDAL